MGEYKRYVDVLAKRVGEAFQKMAGLEVLDISVKEEPQIKTDYSIALIVPYDHRYEQVTGHVALGFTEAPSAVKAASDISQNMGRGQITGLNELAEDTIYEFLNTVLNRTLSGWEVLDFNVYFHSPHPQRETVIQAFSNRPTAAYTILLHLSGDSFSLGVTFHESAGERSKDKKILAAGDTPLMRRIITDTLNKVGFQVEQARSGQDALEKHRNFKPDLTIMDVNITGLAVEEVVQRSRIVDPAAQFILVTSSEKPGDSAWSQRLGCCLHKPVQPKDLLDLIQAMLSPPDDDAGSPAED